MKSKAFALVAIFVLLIGLFPQSITYAQVEKDASIQACPESYRGLGNYEMIGYDSAPNLYVGGDYYGFEGAGELEGVVAVHGDFNRESGGLLNVGVAGVGSRVGAPKDKNALIVGGDINTSTKIEINHDYGGKVVAGGTITPLDLIDANGGEVLENAPNPLAGFDAWPGVLHEISNKYAEKEVNGEVTEEYGTITIKGNGSNETQVFEIKEGMLVEKNYTLNYVNIPKGTEIIINVLGSNPVMNIQAIMNDGIMVDHTVDSSTSLVFVDRTMHTLWNFPEGKNIKIKGSSQLPGSVLVPNKDSITEIETSLNGRAYFGGDVKHGQTGSGLEVHNYPFKPLFDCGYDSTTIGSPDEPGEPEQSIELAPVDPEVTQALCSDIGEASKPRIDLVETEGITYEIKGEVEAGKTVTIIATPEEGYELKETTGWELQSDGTATKTIVLEEVNCEKPTEPEQPIEVAPVNPEVREALCSDEGEPSKPTIDLVETEGITYEIQGEVEAGKTVTILATPEKGYELKETVGWELQSDGTATKTIVLEEVNCEKPTEPEQPIEVAPVNPEVTEALCSDEGETSKPTITLPRTKGIAYEIKGEVEAGKTVTIIATPEEGYELKATAGWELQSDGTATKVITLEEVNCEKPTEPEQPIEVAPVNPEVTEALCSDEGEPSKPTITLPTTEGITYSINGEVEAGKTVEIIATPEAGYKLTETTDWELQDDGTATKIITLEEVECEKPTEPEQPKEVAPVDPKVTQALCGEEGAPTIELQQTEGIVYTIVGEVKPGKELSVVATAEEGYELKETTGWELQSEGIAIKTIKLDELNCEDPEKPIDPEEPEQPIEVAPVDPEVEQALCRDEGEASKPTIDLVETEGITYEIQGEVEAGKTITILATPEKGYELKETVGWELQSDGTATKTIVLEEVNCEKPTEPEQPIEVAPVNPEVTQALCSVIGEASKPTIDLAETEGIKYSIAGDVEAGNTVAIIATPEAGYKLTETTDWELQDDGTATKIITLEEVECEKPTEPEQPKEVAPVDPKVTQALCGEEGAPTIELQQTEGIVYTIVGEVKPGKELSVVATVQEGYELKATAGWELQDDGTATKVITLEELNCEKPIDPEEPEQPTEVTPVDPQALCSGEGAPTIKLPTTDGVIYTIIGEEKAGSIVTIIATPKAGYKLTETAGWELLADGTAITTIKLCDPTIEIEADPTEKEGPSKEGPSKENSTKEKADNELPNTATNHFNVLLAGVMLLFISGMMFFVLSRRKSLN